MLMLEQKTPTWEVTAVHQLIKVFRDALLGVTSGFDRIVFQGMIRPLSYSEGAMGFFCRRRILFKDARDWVLGETERLISAVEAWSQRECGQPITYIPSSKTRKEAIARKRQQEKGITEGLVGTWSCVEAGNTYRIARGEGGPQLRFSQGRCKHLYLYLDHADYGFMSIRIQTWFPYKIQIAMNGREWLVRQLEGAGIGFERCGNKVFQIDDYQAAQSFLDKQLTTKWWALLDGFLPVAFPTMRQTLGEDLSYTWTLWQSEWATDLLFKDRRDIDRVIDQCIRHAFIGGHPARLLSYFGRPLTKDGQPRQDCSDSLRTTIKNFNEGVRIRHWDGSNSVKMYNANNVLRLETSINDPSMFRAHRRKQGAPPDAPKEYLPLRKGVADTRLRARASQRTNDRFAAHIATMHSSEPFSSVLAEVTQRMRKRGRSVRALEPTGKDFAVLKTISDPKFTVRGLCNKDLRHGLAHDRLLFGKTDKQRSATMTRTIRLLRDHGVIRRLPKSRRYQLTSRGRQLVTTTQAALAASVEELTAIAA